MTNLFGVDLITPNYVTSNLAFLQQFDASYSFGEQGHSSLVVAKSWDRTTTSSSWGRTSDTREKKFAR